MNPNRKVALHTLGCKLNFSETSTIARSFVEAGYARVDLDDGADVVVVNTCSVTDQADKKCRNVVRKAKNLNPDAYIAVIGCYAQLKPEEIAKIPGVSIVLGANEKFNLLDHIDQQHPDGTYLVERIKETRDFVPSFSRGDRTRTFLKVQDGCNYFCAFCTIPLARGRSRSASIEETLAEANKVAQTDAQEVVLTGVNIGDFGTPNGETFMDLVKGLDQVEGIERFRISSIEPNLLSNEIIDFCADSEKFVPHFHIPLQSGSDNILKMMRRRYLTDLYQDRINRIHEKFKDACIGVDVIVGFPGETEERFQETFDFLHQLDVAYLHVFTYSERANTTARRIDEVVPRDIRHQRSKELRMLSLKKKRAFYESQLGKVKPVLFEHENHSGMMHGFTDNYVKVCIAFNEAGKCCQSNTDRRRKQLVHESKTQ
ncbi:MAG: tRNA (N(6)-L-threonylcarbamoyladenosine(37)-C(2))-methylthiotransferase MtaB [Flavobacteriales bacterium]|nr:tRNA (N(6)-L-threonylcarbamoyladenosine(37)-C(2))-methylthiotransferase MtaB [Flavobacteriales bacterium]